MQQAVSQAGTAAQARRRAVRTEWLPGYLCVLPALLVISVFSIFPVLYSLGLSLFSWDFIAPQPTFVGLRNFERLFRSADFWQVLRNTLFFSVGTVALILVCSLALALVLDVRLRGIAFFRALFFVPHLTPMVAIATLWLFMYNPDTGVINAALGLFGIEGPRWLQSTTWALPALIIMKTWKAVGYYTVLFLAGLQGIPADLHEAAKVDGARLLQRIRYVTLPLLSPMILFVVVISVIGSFQDFDQVFVMTNGGPLNSTNVLVYYLYEQAFQNYRVGLGSAVAVVLLVILAAFTVLQLRLSRRWVHY
ncbi:MAG: sugar ABC transporter permease [Chloroflexales bacterium]|nr:sugar ABC transporter permease [Chloroflexales bacterium]